MTIRPQTGVHSSALISVIMPCYQGERFLREAVDSVLGQTHPDVELIVVDDGSTDASMEILRSYGDRIKVLSQSNQGPYRARNVALARASGEFVAFLDADDWWDSRALETLHGALVSDPEAQLAYCGWRHVGAEGRSNEPYIPDDLEALDKTVRLLSGGSPWPIHAALVRRNALEQIGGFREDLESSLDFELWLRLASTRKTVRVPVVLAFYRFHGAGQISSKPWRQVINGWRIKRRFLHDERELAASLGSDTLEKLVDRVLVDRGFQLYWRSDLGSAQKIFRKALFVGGWTWGELVYIVPALLPLPLYESLVRGWRLRGVHKQ